MQYGAQLEAAVGVLDVRGAAHERRAREDDVIGAHLVVRHGDLLHDHHEVGEVLHDVLRDHLERLRHLLRQRQRHLHAAPCSEVPLDRTIGGLLGLFVGCLME